MISRLPAYLPLFVPSFSAGSGLNLPENDPRPPPIIRIGPQNQSLRSSTVGLLQCEVMGDPKPTVGWYKNGNPLPDDPRIIQLATGSLQISGN